MKKVKLERAATFLKQNLQDCSKPLDMTLFLSYISRNFSVSQRFREKKEKKKCFRVLSKTAKNRLFLPKWPFYDFLIAWFQLNIHKFKCIARFGLMHIVATNLCVWIRTVVKECTKEIAQYRVNRGHGVSEDYMILGKCISCITYWINGINLAISWYIRQKLFFFHITFVFEIHKESIPHYKF